jgi:hypothetical protein
MLLGVMGFKPADIPEGPVVEDAIHSEQRQLSLGRSCGRTTDPCRPLAGSPSAAPSPPPARIPTNQEQAHK